MADCNETIRELDAFLDGELSDATRAMIHEHLGGCTDCLQAFEFHIELQQAIRRKCSNDVMPPGLLDRIAACFEVRPGVDPVSEMGRRSDPWLR